MKNKRPMGHIVHLRNSSNLKSNDYPVDSHYYVKRLITLYWLFFGTKNTINLYKVFPLLHRPKMPNPGITL